MFFLRAETVVRILLTILIGGTSRIGDVLLYRLSSLELRAVSDNLTHAIVGGLSWSLIVALSGKSIVRNAFGIALCFVISSLIDLDHFLLAKSWRLRDARNLEGQRPILHCSSIPLLLFLISAISYKVFHHSASGYYLWVIITGFLSHHIRDATRRGMWFLFLGSTSPLPYHLYLFMAMALPYSLHWLMPQDFIQEDHRLQPSVLHV
ncbi:transmembrane protein 267 [Neodiprion fabricii]|uniref:transmembrane protein 267 n=1 Tax=Neodiprion fabricii TaxID=2872261 RepID=UPI001ED8CCB4|nr:transmembrane protein 267 [Neodiprion fabricii]